MLPARIYGPQKTIVKVGQESAGGARICGVSSELATISPAVFTVPMSFRFAVGSDCKDAPPMPFRF